MGGEDGTDRMETGDRDDHQGLIYIYNQNLKPTTFWILPASAAAIML